MLIEQINQKNVCFVIIGIFYGPYTCDGCCDLVQRSTDFKNIAIVHIKKSVYRIYFPCMSKHEAKKLIKKYDLIDKTGNINCND